MLTAMLGTKRYGRRRGIAIRAESVRRARIEAGLSLAQVANGAVSRTAIHLIETGRSRPSRETLELIARRTGKPVEFFLDVTNDPVASSGDLDQVSELERLSAARDFGKVIELGSQVLKRPLAPDHEALVRFYVGQAHCRLVQPVDALQHLPIARRTFEQLGDNWMVVETLDWESSAMGLVEDPRAIPIALEALERCRKLEPRPAPTEARILGHIAGMYVTGHSWSQAMRYYEEAVEAAGNVKDLLQLAKMHHGIATVYQRMEQPAKARHHFDKALALYSIESDLSAVYRVENDLGELLLRQGLLDSAETHLRTALVGSSELGIDRRGSGYILGNLGEVSLKKGRLDQARRYLDQAMATGEQTGEQLVVANVHALRAQLEEKQGNTRQADKLFRAALRVLLALEMPDRVREFHMLHARVLEARGDWRAASKHWKAAAQTAESAGHTAPVSRERSKSARQP